MPLATNVEFFCDVEVPCRDLGREPSKATALVGDRYDNDKMEVYVQKARNQVGIRYARRRSAPMRSL